MVDLGGAFSSFGGAVGDLFAASGANAAAKSYAEAAKLELENAQIAKASGNIQAAVERRKIYQSESGTIADAAGAGLRMSGSVQNVLRSSAQQGALAEGLIAAQTQINVTGFQAQANAYQGQATIEKALANSDMSGAIFGFLGGAAKLFGLF